MSEKEINPKKSTAKAAKTVRRTTKAKGNTFDSSDIFEQTTKSLPVLKDAKGNSMSLTVENINTIGTSAGANVGRLADQIMSKVNVTDDNSEFGQSITTILSLTRAVDIDSLQDDKSIVGWVRKLFVNAKQKVGDQYKNSKEQIDEIMNTLQTGINRQHGECEWLDTAYNENKNYLFELRDTLAELEVVTKSQDERLTEMQADSETDTFAIQEQKMICEALSKQEDKIRRLIIMCELSAPRLMSMKKVNLNTVSKFEDLKSVVIPAWKSQLAEQLISERQRKDNELGNLIDNETNRLLEVNSKMVATNMLDAAKANNRGIVDIKTLRNVHKTTIDGIEAVLIEEKKGKEERERAKVELLQLSHDLENTLREIADKSNK
ncbi:hypothetical protein [Escherichia phage vB_EcoM_JNE01]|nr:hypothetical protein [Escherichia phage vB_EcoM_JNE01]